MGPRVVLIVNPRATGVTPERIARLTAALERRCELVRWETERRGHARELAAAAVGRADALVIFAGDGTYNEAINGAAGELPFGFVPGGGASVFPRALGLPRDPLEAAARILDALERGRSSSIALGRINGRRFCFTAGVGVDAEVVRRVEERGRDGTGRRGGAVAFFGCALGALAATRFHIAPQLEVEGYGRAALVVVLNGKPYTYAGRLPIPLLAAADFGAGLDFVAPREITPWRVPGLTLRVLRGTVAGDGATLTGHDVDGLHILCDRPLPAQADGEDLGDLGEAVFECNRDALAVLR